MPNFGEIPKDKGYGFVPKFVFRIAGVLPGPKALYASLCTNASSDGIVWRSLTKLGKEFDVSTRQVQRWVNDLERAGLLVRIGWRGTSNRFLVIRDEKGVPWAKREGAKKIVGRRVARGSRSRTTVETNSLATATLMSPEPDVEVASDTTSRSYKHNLTNQNKRTDQIARQVQRGADRTSSHAKTWGLKRLNEGQRAEDVQTALNAIGWENILAMSKEQIRTELESHHGLQLTAEEERAFLGP